VLHEILADLIDLLSYLSGLRTGAGQYRATEGLSMSVEKWNHQFVKNVQVVLDAFAERARDQYGAVIDTAVQLRRYQSDVALAVADHSKTAVDRVMRESTSSVDFARKIADEGSAAARSIASAKSPTELLQAQDAYLRSSMSLCAGEITNSANRFFEAMSGWAAWPNAAGLTAAT
jgi:hypothetical protein